MAIAELMVGVGLMWLFSLVGKLFHLRFVESFLRYIGAGMPSMLETQTAFSLFLKQPMFSEDTSIDISR